MTLKDRVKQFCERKNIAVTKFEREAGLSNGYFRGSTARMGDDKMERIHRAFPDLNMDWLVTGFGEMLIANPSINIGDILISPTDAPITLEAPTIAQMLTVSPNQEIEVDLDEMMNELRISAMQLAHIIGEAQDFLFKSQGKLLPRHIHALEKHYGEEKIVKYVHLPSAPVAEVEIIEAFPVVTEAVNADPNTSIEKVIEEDGAELEHINPNHLLRTLKVDAAELVKSTSMLPTYQPNDWVFVKLLKDKMKITDGSIYYINCKNRPTMIRLVKFEGDDKLRLIAQNSQFGDIVINRSDIIDIGTCEALFRMTFGDQYSELETLRRNKDAQIDKRDTQLDKMLEVLGKQAEQQSRLIDAIIGNK